LYRYDNGDIKFWSLPWGKVTTASESEGFGIGTEPLRLVRLARGSFRAPVTALRWSGASSRDGGRMYVLGGGSGGTPDVVRVRMWSAIVQIGRTWVDGLVLCVEENELQIVCAAGRPELRHGRAVCRVYIASARSPPFQNSTG
jgi:hypothetical protein